MARSSRILEVSIMKPDLLDGLTPQECSLKVDDSDQDDYNPDLL